jgi:dTDP-4-dehydrorhamnose reductase
MVERYPILLLGGNGQIGTEVRRQAARFAFDVTAPSHQDLDLLHGNAIAEAVASRRWSAVVNCAAYTNVDGAESNATLAHAVNSTAPGLLAEATATAGIPLLHLSTDYVFNGTKSGKYEENDPAGPISLYGASKLAGENAVKQGNDRHFILRTAWVVSPWGSNFLKTIVRLALEREEVRVVADQHGCPTSAADVAGACLTIIAATPDKLNRYGTYHFVNEGSSTWFDFATFIVDTLRNAGHKVARLVPVTTADYPVAACRPANSELSTDKIKAEFGIDIRPWRAAISKILSEFDLGRAEL